MNRKRIKVYQDFECLRHGWPIAWLPLLPIWLKLSSNCTARPGFQVKEVCADHEFKPVLHILQDCRWSFTTNLANAQEHVPTAKHNNCVLKECIHATYHGIPYKVLPRTIICCMVMETAAKLNYFPTKGSCMKYFSPQEILHHVKLDYKKHCSMPLLIMISLTLNLLLPTLVMHMHWIVFSYVQFT